jgi:pimeloyl-ACP methyl ester carboxylesterase
MHIDTVAMFRAICSDLPLDLAYENGLHFQHHSGASFAEKVTQVAYTDVPVSYIFCEDDLVVSPEMQRKFIGVIEEAKGGKIPVVSLKAGHCPNFSIPEALARAIVEEAERAE